MTVVLPPTDSTLPITGKFCRALGPVSASPESLAVTPAGPRSIPSAPLPKMLLPRIEAVPSVTVMPTALLWAMTLPSPAATPPVLGLIYQCKQAEQALAATNNERKNKDTECKAFLTSARTSLLPILGRDPSPEWALAGFANPPASSNAVPGTQEGRLQCLSALAVYLTQHPTYEVPAGGPRPEITSTRALALHNQLSTCRATANSASNAQNDALTAKRAALQSLRRTLIALVDELQLRLPDDDPRWEVFGLNIPANPRPPEPASDLTLTSAGLGRILAEWEPGTRSDDDRILIQIVGVDADYREYGKSGGDGEELLKNLPAGATVKVKIIALNGSLEAPSGPEAQIVVV